MSGGNLATNTFREYISLPLLLIGREVDGIDVPAEVLTLIVGSEETTCRTFDETAEMQITVVLG